ncbi:MAG: PRC-barrel domain-containing protein [Pseudomonadota bacterium]
MKNLMLSTALLAGLTGAAMAQTDGSIFRPAANAMDLRASNFIGMRVYASDAALDATEYNGAQTGWNDIGEINDVILSRDGKIDAVLVDIGGFLGLGERQVAVGMEAITFVADSATADIAEDFFLVMTADRATLEAAPDYMAGTMPADMPAADMPADATMAPADATADPATDTAATPAARTPIARDGYMLAEADYLTSEKLTGAKVYDSNDAWIGDIANLVLSADGNVTQAVVDVGGFLGLGAKPVALDLADIDILRNEGGDDVRVYLSRTKAELEAMPNFEG